MSQALRRGTRNGITEYFCGGRHRCSAGRPSRWASAHILVATNTPLERAITSRFRPDVEHVLEQVDVLVELVGGVYVDVGVWRRTDDRRAEADGQVERRHLVDIGTHGDALQVIEQVRQRVLHITQTALRYTAAAHGDANQRKVKRTLV